MIEAHFEPRLESWRNEARRLLNLGAHPRDILWGRSDEQSFFNLEDVGPVAEKATQEKIFNVPREFLEWARFISCHRDPARWSLLYRLLYRLKNENRLLMQIPTDPDVHQGQLFMKSVTRDIHKMHAFVRFKSVRHQGQEAFVAWHRPEHLILEEGATFFQRRFGDKPWMIFTPDRSAFWDLKQLHFGAGMPQHDFQIRDDVDEIWTTYYASIFNPARIKMKAMRAEMAPKYWSTLPEAKIIHELVRGAGARLDIMAKNQNVQAEVKPCASIIELNVQLRNCKACPLFATAHQVVKGVGSSSSGLMIVGEQPGDQEDQTGLPFVGPAGQLLDGKLAEMGLHRQDIYITNAVKHFKWKASGKLRLHQKASGSEMHACRPWLEEEIKFVRPKVILALGVTAATSILGRLPKISKERGAVIRGSPYAPAIVLSWHPAAILRSMDLVEQRERSEQLGLDLKLAAAQLVA